MKRQEVLLEMILQNPGLYADDLAKRLGLSTKLVVDLVGELLDGGMLESSDCPPDVITKLKK